MTDHSLEHWPRPRFVQLPLNALTFFAIYGALDETFPALPHQEYRSLGLPTGMELGHHLLSDRPELKEHFQSGAGWNHFCQESPQAMEALQHATACLCFAVICRTPIISINFAIASV